MFGRFVGLATDASEAIARIASSFISQAEKEAREGPLYFLVFETSGGKRVSGFGIVDVKLNT
jgi:hypothetical protein